MNQFITTTMFIVCAFFTTNVFAQGFDVSPTSIFFDAEPTQSKTTQLTVKNVSNQKQKFNISLRDWTEDKAGNPKYLAANSSKNSCAGWVEVSPTFVELGPNEARKINVVISVPAGQSVTKWATLIVKPANEQQAVLTADKEAIQGGLQPVGVASIPIYQGSKSNKDIKATIKNFRGDKENKAVYMADVVNTGSTILQVNVQAVLSNIETGEEYEVSSKDIIVLPGYTRAAEFLISNKVPKGKYSFTAVLDYGGDDLEGVQDEIEIK